jgi:hypothetical protein
LNVQPPGPTVLTGQVRDENDKPVAGVTIKLGGTTPDHPGLHRRSRQLPGEPLHRRLPGVPC